MRRGTPQAELNTKDTKVTQENRLNPTENEMWMKESEFFFKDGDAMRA
jgi:hypothetical protein